MGAHHQKRKREAMTTVIKEKLVLNLSFPLAHIKWQEGAHHHAKPCPSSAPPTPLTSHCLLCCRSTSRRDVGAQLSKAC